MTTNPGKAAWAARKAAALDAQLAALPKATDLRSGVQLSRTAAWLRSEAARYRRMAAQWAPAEAA